MEKLLLDSEPEHLREERLAQEKLLKPVVLQVEPSEPVIEGIMLKKNKYFMK